MTKPLPPIDIVIPVHNAPESVRCLFEQLDMTVPGHKRIIVNDASDSETTTVIAEYSDGRDDVLTLANRKQQLFTRTVNKGIRVSETDRIAVVNTDMKLRPGWLERLNEAMGKSRSIGLVGYPLRCNQDEDWDKRVIEPGYVTGHCVLLKREMLEEIGLYCETDIRQAHILSDMMLSYRANAAGWRTVEVRAPLCEHGDGASWHRNYDWLFHEFDYSQLEPGKDTF